MTHGKYNKILRRILFIVLSVCVIFVFSNVLICKMFYNPYKDFQSTSSVFSMTSQLLSPSITWSYLDSSKANTLFKFSNYSQKFILHKFSYVKNEWEEENTGILRYSFGKAALIEYNNKLGIDDLTTTQSVFMEQNVDKIKSYWEVVNSNRYYEVWLKFNLPMNSSDLQRKYINLLDNNISRPNHSGIIWIPIKSSDRPSDICIGMQGNFSWHCMNPYNILAGSNSFYSMDSVERELLLYQSLQYLTDHSKDTKILLKSGLYVNCENLDFKEKNYYIKENGILCLGMVAYLRGDTLLSLKDDNNLEIVKLMEDGKN